jgi:hypothetical protein
MNENHQLLVYAGSSSLVGFLASSLYQYFTKREKKEETYQAAVIQDFLATLPSSLLIPSTIKQSFINIYSLESPALITYFYGISKSLPSLFGITLGRALMIISATKIYTSSNNRLIHLICSMFGLLIYFYSKKLFQASVLKGNLNVFNGSLELNEMGDSETRVYKSMVKLLKNKPEETAKFLSINQEISEILNYSPKMFSIKEDDEILNPFYIFIDKELNILEVSNREMESISPSQIQKKLKVKGGGMVQGLDRILKKSTINETHQQKIIDGYTNAFKDKYKDQIIQEFQSNYFAHYAIPVCISLTFGIFSFNATNILYDEFYLWRKENKKMYKCVRDAMLKIWNDYSNLFFMLGSCGLLSYSDLYKKVMKIIKKFTTSF